MIKLLKGDDATHVVAVDLPEAAYADGVKIEFKIGGLTLLMPAAPRVVITFPSTWTAIQSCGRLLGSFSLISPTGQRGTITKTYPVYITDDVSAVGAAGPISGNIIPAIDFSDLPSLDATSTPGDTKAVLNEILRRLKACCITLAMVLTVPFLGLAAEVKTAPLDDVAGTTPVVTNVSFEGLAKKDEVLFFRGPDKDFIAQTDAGGVELRWIYDHARVIRLSPEIGVIVQGMDYSSYYSQLAPWSLTIGSQFRLHRDIYTSAWRYYIDDGHNEAVRIYFPSLYELKKSDTIALLGDIEKTTNNIPQLVTNVVRDVQGLVYDEKLGITWKKTMYDGNLYYIAVTNANITEVK